MKTVTSAVLAGGFSLLATMPVSAQELTNNMNSSPLHITKGGTYSGNWISTDPNVPAVKIDTTEPVYIQNCNIQSAGIGIQDLYTNGQLSVYNCYARAINPNVYGQKKGPFIKVVNFGKLHVTYNTVEGYYQGVSETNYGDGLNLRGQYVYIYNNYFKNIDGRQSDGNNGYLTVNTGGNAVFLNSMTQVNGYIAYNRIVNLAYQSNSGDTISTYGSSGIPGYSYRIFNNYIEGGYPPDPTVALGFDGTMINIGDALGPNVGWMKVYNNHVVSFDNSGILLSAGHNNEVYNNRVVSAQYAPGGYLLNGNYRSGLVFWDYYGGAPLGYWHDNSMHDNYVNVIYPNGQQAKDYTPGPISGTNTFTNNTNTSGHLATLQDVAIELQLWKAEMKSLGLRVGCYLSINSACE